MAKLINTIARILGIQDSISLPVLDLVKELEAGKLILVDSGIHSPVQYWVREIAMWDQFVDQKTVEIRSWTSGFSSHPNFRHFIETHDGECQVRADCIRFLGDIEMPVPTTRGSVSLGENLVKQVRTSIQSMKKTVVKFRYHDEKEIVRIEDVLQTSIETVRSLADLGEALPLFLVEIGVLYDTPHIRSLIRELHGLGARVVVVRLVDTPTSISDMDADVHILERTPFLPYLRDDSEVILGSGEYASVSPFYKQPGRQSWMKRERQKRAFPSISAYNADPDGYR
jgi:hypothetical protein